MPLGRRPVFALKKWLTPEEFRELLEIADYMGRTPSQGSLFALNMSKIADKGYDEAYVEDLLRRLGASEKDIEEAREFIVGFSKIHQVRVVLRHQGARLVVEPKGYLGSVFESIRGLVRYDRQRKIFTSYPAHYKLIKSRLASSGALVEDLTGFSAERYLPQKPSLGIGLRSYQEEALSTWESRGFRGIVSLPTGAGKTVVGVGAVVRKPLWTLVVAFTREQMRQWMEHFTKRCSLPEHVVGLYYSEEKRIAPVTIATYQTAYRYVDKLSQHFPLLIVDEVHHLPADKFKGIALGMFSPYRLGLSATVTREDGRHEELFPLMGGVIYHKTPQELVEEGYLAPFRIEVVGVDLKPDEKRRYEELRRKYRDLSRGMEFEQLVEAAKKGDQLAAEALKVRSELRQLVHSARAKMERLRKIVESERARGSKILIFTQYVDQAEEIGKALGVPVITGEMDKRLRDRNFELFKQGVERVLVMTTVGDEGIDVPDANVGIVVAGTGSKRQFIQRLGRLLRPGEGKQAVLYEIIARGTHEEIESRRRREALEDLLS